MIIPRHSEKENRPKFILRYDDVEAGFSGSGYRIQGFPTREAAEERYEEVVTTYYPGSVLVELFELVKAEKGEFNNEAKS